MKRVAPHACVLILVFPFGGCGEGAASPHDAADLGDGVVPGDGGVDGQADARPPDAAAPDATAPDAAAPDAALPDAGNPCDQDDDGVLDYFCGGPDCNPWNDAIPAAAEDCVNGVDDDCDGDIDWADSECAPANDTCATPEDISGGGIVASWTEGAVADYGTYVIGPDVVYSFSLAAPKVATVRLTVPQPPPPPPTNLEVQFNVFVGDACPPDGGNWNSFYCAGGGGAFCMTLPASIEKCLRLDAGAHFAVVQVGTRNVWPQSGYPFSLELVLQDPPALACGSLTDVSTGGSFLLDVNDPRWVDALGWCGADGTREALFSMTVDATTNVLIATPDQEGALYFLPTCDADAAALPLVPPQLNLAPGSYVIVKELGALVWPAVDSHLEITLATPGEACADATPITGTGSYSGTTAGGVSRLVTNPYPDVHGYGPEVVYRLDLATQTRVVADLIPFYSGAILYFETECGVSSTADYWSFDPDHKDEILAPGTYYLVVDGDDAGDEGGFILNVTFI